MAKPQDSNPSEYSESITCPHCNCCRSAYRLADGSPACYTCAVDHGHKPRSLTAARKARQHLAADAAEGRRLLRDIENVQRVAQAIERGEEVDAKQELMDLKGTYAFRNHYLRIAGVIFVMMRDSLRGKTPKHHPLAMEFDAFLENGLNDLELESCLLGQEIQIAAHRTKGGMPAQHGVNCLRPGV